ncbi:MAG: 30S ribosomal protein S4 [Patescibacteria group bacterium]|nr:30S ribosomal protein S4 [Patescibacteria group bacterium]MDD4304331.1 30S ribosomal protein S4 [Patescibacteria group bacterium]MDD4695594.1 30S ribosomal protein S4 [Patescibacteria group bacterium]
MRKISSKCKLCRAEGQKLLLKGERCMSSKCAMIKKNYKPGVHGPKKSMTKLSAYGKQLREKQKTKRTYGMLEKPFAILVKKALQSKGDAGRIITNKLENRFDNIVYRCKLANSRNTAKQIISHNHLKINDKSVNISSYELRIGDKISVKENKLKDKYWEKLKESLKNEKDMPTWLNVDTKNLTAQVIGSPDYEELEKSINTSLIIEFYSR